MYAGLANMLVVYDFHVSFRQQLKVVVLMTSMATGWGGNMHYYCCVVGLFTVFFLISYYLKMTVEGNVCALVIPETI